MQIFQKIKEKLGNIRDKTRDEKKKVIFDKFLHIVMDMNNIRLYKYIFFMLTCVDY